MPFEYVETVNTEQNVKSQIKSSNFLLFLLLFITICLLLRSSDSVNSIFQINLIGKYEHLEYFYIFDIKSNLKFKFSLNFNSKLDSCPEFEKEFKSIQINILTDSKFFNINVFSFKNVKFVI